MARFSYTAEKNDGDVYRRTAEAQDRYELYSMIRREGAHLVELKEDHSDKWWSFDYWNARIGTVNEQDKVTFARNISAMISAGLPLPRALSVMERQTQSARFKSIINQVGDSVRHGSTMHEALSKFPGTFSPLMVAMVRAGEEGGDVPAALALVADQTERSLTLKKKIKGAMLYPSIIMVAIFGIGALLMTQVVPTLAATFIQLHAKLPQSTLIVMAISDFLTHHTIVAFGGIVAVVIAVITGSHTKEGKRALDFLYLHIPVISGMTREVNSARMARTMSSLLAAGVDMITAIAITRDIVQNGRFKDLLEGAQKGVTQGEPLSRAFLHDGNLYPPFVGEMIAVGEETGEVPEMLKRIASYYEDEVDRKTKDMSSIIEPFLMLFIGAVVGFFAISMISPIYQLTGSIH